MTRNMSNTSAGELPKKVSSPPGVYEFPVASEAIGTWNETDLTFDT